MTALFVADVIHTRTRPRPHHMKIKALFFVTDPLDHKAPTSFPYAFRRKDHGLLRDGLDFFYQYCQEQGHPIPRQSSIKLYTQFSFLGYNFNPISLYVVHNQHHTPVLVILEVSNTYREQKVFFVPPDPAKSGQFSLKIPKDFYISPFITPDGELRITIQAAQDRLNVRVDSYEQQQLTLSAVLSGHQLPSTLGARLKSLLWAPLGPLRVMALIHFHALLLYLKKIPFHNKELSNSKQKGLLHGKH